MHQRDLQLDLHEELRQARYFLIAIFTRSEVYNDSCFYDTGTFDVSRNVTWCLDE